ncbi:MAG: DUF692 family protein [Deltaproteobacteria bacterium]|nr:DUF692 family protein [Deltaproteobacteria bacterium]
MIRRLSFGVGMDLTPSSTYGFDDRGALSDRVARFLRSMPSELDHFFFSFQRRGRSTLRADDYFPSFDDLMTHVPSGWTRALHHTLLNLGTTGRYDRRPIFELTNELIARYELAWVNEDLGLWSIDGRPMPYPLPPLLTENGLRASIRNVRECMTGLDAPLVVEFPGFADGPSVWVGELDAYDFFRQLAEETSVHVTLDVGHLLSWRWAIGHRGAALFDGLDRLPLASCFELHLSGCTIRAESFVDAHHGVLLDEQLELAEQLIERCPNLRAVTFEDPRYTRDGQLTRKSRTSFERLRRLVPRAPERSALARPERRLAEWNPAESDRHVGGRLESTLSTLLHEARTLAGFLDGSLSPELSREDRETLGAIDRGRLVKAAEATRHAAFSRSHAGSGRLTDAFEASLASYRSAHSDDPGLDVLRAAFLESDEFKGSKELPFSGPGIAIEEAFGAFLSRLTLAPSRVIGEETDLSLLRAVAALREPEFELPRDLILLEHGAAFARGGPVPSIHGLIANRVVRGPIDARILEVLEGRRHAEPALEAALRKVGLIRRSPWKEPPIRVQAQNHLETHFEGP